MEERISANNQEHSEQTFHKQSQIKDLVAGDVISDIFVVKAKSSVQSYANDTKYRFTLTLTDKSGEINAKYWGSEDMQAVQGLQESLKSGDVVHITARVQEYLDNTELSINDSGITRLEEGQYNAQFFIQESDKDLEQLYADILETIHNISNQDLKLLCSAFYLDSDFRNSFCQVPASKMHQYAFLGGLVEHTHNILQMAKALCVIHSELDQDLLLSIVLLAPIGKTQHFKIGTNIDFTQEGYLLGDMILSYDLLQDQMTQFPDFDKELHIKLLNAIVSQQGKVSWGAVKRPATAEALVYARLKELDSSLAQFLSVKKHIDSDEAIVFTKGFGNILR